MPDVEMLRANAVSLFHRFRPGQPEWNMLMPPIIVFWVIAIAYDILDNLPYRWIRRYRIVRKEPPGRNPMSKRDVILRVLMQQTIQTVVGLALMVNDADMCKASRNESMAQTVVRFVLGMFVMDTYHYWVHRAMHDIKFLYRHLHAKHHALNVPYSYGALYNTALEALLLDTVVAGFTHYVAGLTCNTAGVLLTLATIKGTLDHCGYRWPVNPLHDLFPNSAAFHDVHHHWRWGQSNLSQLYFTHWDWLCGTFVDPNLKHLTPEEVDEKDAAADSHRAN